MLACCQHDGQDLPAHSPKACSLACFHEVAWQDLAHDGFDSLIDIYHHQLASRVSRHVHFWKHSPSCSFTRRQNLQSATLASVHDCSACAQRCSCGLFSSARWNVSLMTFKPKI